MRIELPFGPLDPLALPKSLVDRMFHAVGHERRYRNGFAAASMDEFRPLLDLGLITHWPHHPGDYWYWSVTERGIAALDRIENHRNRSTGLRWFDVFTRECPDDSWPTFPDRTVLAKSRGAARWDVVSDLQECGLTAREALQHVRVLANPTRDVPRYQWRAA